MIYLKLSKWIKAFYAFLYFLFVNESLSKQQPSDIKQVLVREDDIDQDDKVDEIIWIDCEDTYKPIETDISDFINARSLSPFFCSAYITDAAHNRLIEHLNSNLHVEQGGILFGNAYVDSTFGIYVEVTGAIAAPSTHGSSTHLEFTPDSWKGIMDHASQFHPEENIVGWYHSHPNLGVFMSSTDMKTHQAFFSHPWCLSIVYDPVRKQIGYFQGLRSQKLNPVIFSCVTSR